MVNLEYPIIEDESFNQNFDQLNQDRAPLNLVFVSPSDNLLTNNL